MKKIPRKKRKGYRERKPDAKEVYIEGTRKSRAGVKYTYYKKVIVKI